MAKVTLCIYPAMTDQAGQCRIYAMPYPMRPGQRPWDILLEYRSAWREIGLMGSDGRIICMDHEYRPFFEDCSLHGGMFFEVEMEEVTA